MSQPAATSARMAAAALYDPAPGTVHVEDISRKPSLYRRRISDHVFGMLWYGRIESANTKFDVCEFRMAFTPDLDIRPARIHEGHPFLGPDGLVLQICGIPYNGGDATIGISPLNGSGVLAHPNYNRWVSSLLFRSGGRTNSLYHAGILNGTIRPPGFAVDQTPVPSPTFIHLPDLRYLRSSTPDTTRSSSSSSPPSNPPSNPSSNSTSDLSSNPASNPISNPTSNPTSNSTSSPFSSSSSNSWIYGAVAGSAVGIALIAVFLLWFFKSHEKPTPTLKLAVQQ